MSEVVFNQKEFIDNNVKWYLLSSNELGDMMVNIYASEIENQDCRMEVHYRRRYHEWILKKQFYYVDKYKGQFSNQEKLKSQAEILSFT